MSKFEFNYNRGYQLGFNSLNENNFISEIREMINSDTEILERADKINIEFAETLKTRLKRLEELGNMDYAGTMVLNLIDETPRYSFYKNIEHNGKKYEIQIDELNRKFDVIEV